MSNIHRYQATIAWTGNRGTGTNNYGAYGRDHEIYCPGKPVIAVSSDPAFRGDPNRYNPEELLVASISSRHMLWYLHLCADAGVTVTAYEDSAEGRLEERADGSGRFTEVVLRPNVTIAAGADTALAERLHAKAHEKCFIANSVNFPISYTVQVFTS
jgi:organic hydroperoxide reductase OsmC/OhrA